MSSEVYELRSVMCEDGVCRQFSIKLNLDDMFARAAKNSLCWEKRKLGNRSSVSFPVGFKYVRDVPEGDLHYKDK